MSKHPPIHSEGRSTYSFNWVLWHSCNLQQLYFRILSTASPRKLFSSRISYHRTRLSSIFVFYVHFTNVLTHSRAMYEATQHLLSSQTKAAILVNHIYLYWLFFNFLQPKKWIKFSYYQATKRIRSMVSLINSEWPKLENQWANQHFVQKRRCFYARCTWQKWKKEIFTTCGRVLFCYHIKIMTENLRKSQRPSHQRFLENPF